MSLADLTKQQVVEVLAEFEEKLPNIGTKIFESDKSITATNVDLNAVSESLSKGVVCPACGYVNVKTRVDRLKALKCPKCYHYFVWDGRPLKLKTSKC